MIQPNLPSNIGVRKYVAAIDDLTAYLHSITKPDLIEFGHYENTYKKLKGVKKFYDNASWDVIEIDVKEQWLKDSRKDEQFKEYYKLRSEIERLEVLVK